MECLIQERKRVDVGLIVYYMCVAYHTKPHSIEIFMKWCKTEAMGYKLNWTIYISTLENSC